MTLQYSVLAWDSTHIQSGTLLEGDLELKAAAPDLPLEDIRNCSSVSEWGWSTVTGVNRQTRLQELWRFELQGTRAESLVTLDYLLHNAIDPSGRYICYTAPPSRTRGDMSLYNYDPQTSRSDLVCEAAVSRYCVPSWRPSTGKIVYHTIDRQVAEVDIGTKEVAPLFQGEFPAVSPDGIWIAYRKGNEIRLWNTVDGDATGIFVKRWSWEGQIHGEMSWSPDARFLLVSQSAGVVRHQLAFYCIEVKTGRRVRARQRYLQGLRFV